MKILNQQEMRHLEEIAIEDFRMTSRLLMENAGRSIFDYIKDLNKEFSKVIILCGLGNNGGDGFVLARQLYNRDIPFEIFVIGDADKIKGDALSNLDILRKLEVDINTIEDKYKIRSLEQIIDKNDLIIDAILGIGIKGPVRELSSEVIEVINSLYNTVISVDLPSGVNSDTGTIENIAVKADATITLGLPKFGNILFPGANYNGDLKIGHVGISPKIADAIASKTFIITKKMIKEYIPKRTADSHKGTYGKASVIAGSRGLSGAAILTCLAALNSGVGIMELFIPESIDLIISTKVVEIITRPLKETPNGLIDLSSITSVVKGIEASNVVAIGPGCGNSNELFELLKQIINASESPIVIDADGLNALSKNIEVLKDSKSKIVLTPHLGEMSRLVDRPIEEIKKDKINLNESEDIHSLVEKRLTEKIGELAGKMHTARSRNDQVALDMRLFLRKEVNNIEKLLQNLMSTILEIADENLEVIMPGYTHLQRAQPITFSHHFLAYYFKLKRDYERLEDNLKRINIMPLGSGALAGSSFPLDREWVSSELGFNRPAFNSIDGVSDRDYIVEFLAIVSNIMIHLSSFSEEIILWNSKEFNFISLADKYTTGSSIMPQKKNPDLAELVRGKTGMTFGNLFQLMTTLKGLPLAYNKDLQEDKESVFDTIDTIKAVLEVYPSMVKKINVNKKRMELACEEGFINATELANYLSRKNISFRKAHKLVGKLVVYLEEEEKSLTNLSLKELRKILPKYNEYFDGDIYNYLDTKNLINNTGTDGGPSSIEITKKIYKAEKYIVKEEI